MMLWKRKKNTCERHEWASTTNSGLMRSICTVCGTITFEPVDQELTIPESLLRVSGAS